MSWADVGKVISGVAPIAASILTGNVIGAAAGVGKLLADYLGVGDNEVAVSEIVAQKGLNSLSEFDIKYATELLAYQKAVEIAAFDQAEGVRKLAEKELASDNLFKSSWRGLFGYVMSITFFIWMTGFVGLLWYVVIKDGAVQAAAVIEVIGKLIEGTTFLWIAAFAVLGVNISKRSGDKRALAGVESPSAVGKLVTKLFS